jgi:nitroreductase
MTPTDYLLSRRSVKAKDLIAPGPDAAALTCILKAATRVPDHGKLCPWRILVLHKEGQAKLGEIFARRFAALNPDANEKQIAFERERPERAPLLLVVLSTPAESIKAPLWEQHLSAGAVCMNILHAAHMLGFGGNWLTEWPAYDGEILAALGGKAGDAVAGFIYLGSIGAAPEERERPDLAAVVSEWR